MSLKDFVTSLQVWTNVPLPRPPREPQLFVKLTVHQGRANIPTFSGLLTIGPELRTVPGNPQAVADSSGQLIAQASRPSEGQDIVYVVLRSAPSSPKGPRCPQQ